MPLVPFNSVGGYATGITGTTVIDSNGNIFAAGISAAGATFTGLARFTAGISASGGITFSPRVYVDGNILTSPNGVIESGYNGWFRGLQWVDPNGGRARIVLNYSSTPRSIDFKVDGVSFDGSGELTRMQLFASGLSCSQGATFSGDIAVNGGDITTTSTSASLFNANATTLNILNTQSSGFTLNIGSATTYSGTKNINIGGNVGGGARENVRIGSQSSASIITILGGITLGAVGGATVRVSTPSEFVVESTSTVNGIATFNGQGRFTAGISAAGATFNGTVTVSGSNILNAGSIQTDKAALEIDTARAASRVAIGDFNGLCNGNYIYIRNATNELDLVNPTGEIKIGDINAVSTGSYIYYYADENRLSSATNSNITEFGNIYANIAFYETSNQIRVTNNARSWFL